MYNLYKLERYWNIKTAMKKPALVQGWPLFYGIKHSAAVHFSLFLLLRLLCVISLHGPGYRSP